jgi:hypothetical protein
MRENFRSSILRGSNASSRKTASALAIGIDTRENFTLVWVPMFSLKAPL